MLVPRIITRALPAVAAAQFTIGTLAASTSYDNITFPAGDISFADEITSYEPLYNLGAPGGDPAVLQSTSGFNIPSVALGQPDVDGVLSGHFVGIGHGGRLTVGFTDNILVADGTPAPDLHIFEAGSTPEGMTVEVSPNGTEWIPVGSLGNTAGDLNIDLDAFGLGTTMRFRYVRITDDGIITSTSNSRGVDIDSIGAISSIPAPTALTPLVQAGDSWSIYEHDSEPAPDWKLPSYVESSDPTGWRPGSGSFGYLVNTNTSPAEYTTALSQFNGPFATTLLNFNQTNHVLDSKFITTYFRKTIQLADIDFSALEIGARWDDGMVVFVNGIEMRRENMPAGTATAATLAVAAVGLPAAKSYTSQYFANPAANPFHVGSNVIAVELHQSQTMTTDAYLEIEMKTRPVYHGLGEALIGAYQDFEHNLWVGQFRDDPLHRFYRREGIFQQLQYDVKYAAIDAAQGVAIPPVLEASSSGTDSRQLKFQRNTDYTLVSERMDARNYENIQARVQIRTKADSNVPWDPADFVKGVVMFSVDGVQYSEIPWFDYFHPGTVSKQELISDSRPYFWQVPTISAAPTSSVTNPTDWNSFQPALWSDFMTPPGASPPSNPWHAGNVFTTPGVRGGIGYDNSVAPFDFTSYLDSTSSAAFKSEAFAKESRVNVRIPFTVDVDFSRITKVELDIQFDDAFSSWLASDLNSTTRAGVKLVAEADPGFDTEDSVARDDASALVYKKFDVTTLFKANAAKGAGNVLCLRGINAGKSSSDMLLHAKLTISLQDIPTSPLNLLETNGGLTTLTSPPGLIPNGVKSVKVKLQCHLAGETNLSDHPYCYIDNLSTLGTPKSAVDLASTLALALPVTTFAPDQRLAGADADGDGISNLLEYAFGSYPENAARSWISSNGVPESVTPALELDAGRHLQLTFRKLHSILDGPLFAESGAFNVNDLSYCPELSTDGLHWQSGQFDMAGNVSNSDGTQTVMVVTKAPMDGVRKMFCRIKVSTTRESWLAPTPDPGAALSFPE